MAELAKQSSEKLPQGIPPGETAQVRCSFYRGTGKDPFGIMSWMSNCPICLGKGVVRVKAPYRPCPHCRGTGAIKTFTCTVCRGTGYVPRPAGPTLVCPECGGTGDDMGDPAMACMTCRGLGLVAPGES
jgi:DnaJ-class molecular chaperone